MSVTPRGVLLPLFLYPALQASQGTQTSWEGSILQESQETSQEGRTPPLVPKATTAVSHPALTAGLLEATVPWAGKAFTTEPKGPLLSSCTMPGPPTSFMCIIPSNFLSRLEEAFKAFHPVFPLQRLNQAVIHLPLYLAYVHSCTGLSDQALSHHGLQGQANISCCTRARSAFQVLAGLIASVTCHTPIWG